MRAKGTYVVVGGGLAGLSAAIGLASEGNEVTLCEQSREMGGRAATHHRQGFALNIGPHGFYRAGVMKTQFDAWGIPFSGQQPLGDGKSVLFARGALHTFPAGAASLMSSGAFTVAEKLRLAAILARLPTAVAHEGESMQVWIERQASSEAARKFLSALTRLSTYAADLDLLDAAAALKQVQMALKASVLYLDGGWETLIRGLTAKAQSLGVVVRSQIAAVSARSGSVILRGGERLDADGVVLAVPPRAVEALTGAALPDFNEARAACLDLGLGQLPPKAATFALGLDEPTYVSVHSKYATGLAPASGALVQIAMYLRRGQTCSREELEACADLSMPGWREQLVLSRFLPEMTVVHAIPRAGRGRPDVDTLKAMPGIMVAGDWVGPEAMLADAAVASGLRAARRIKEHREALAA